MCDLFGLLVPVDEGESYLCHRLADTKTQTASQYDSDKLSLPLT